MYRARQRSCPSRQLKVLGSKLKNLSSIPGLPPTPTNCLLTPQMQCGLHVPVHLIHKCNKKIIYREHLWALTEKTEEKRPAMMSVGPLPRLSVSNGESRKLAECSSSPLSASWSHHRPSCVWTSLLCLDLSALLLILCGLLGLNMSVYLVHLLGSLFSYLSILACECEVSQTANNRTICF